MLGAWCWVLGAGRHEFPSREGFGVGLNQFTAYGSGRRAEGGRQKAEGGRRSVERRAESGESRE